MYDKKRNEILDKISHILTKTTFTPGGSTIIIAIQQGANGEVKVMGGEEDTPPTEKARISLLFAGHEWTKKKDFNKPNPSSAGC